jgi:hypothetical protein
VAIEQLLGTVGRVLPVPLLVPPLVAEFLLPGEFVEDHRHQFRFGAARQASGDDLRGQQLTGPFFGGSAGAEDVRDSLKNLFHGRSPF